MTGIIGRCLEQGAGRFGRDFADPKELSTLERFGLVRRDGHIETMICGECEDAPHFPEVERDGEGFGYFCPNIGVVGLSPEDVQAWRADTSAILAGVGAVLGTAMATSLPLADDRVIGLGQFRRRLDGKARTIDVCAAIGQPDDLVIGTLWETPPPQLRGHAHLLVTTRNWPSIFRNLPQKWAIVDASVGLTLEPANGIVANWFEFEAATLEALDRTRVGPGQHSDWFYLLRIIGAALENDRTLTMEGLQPKHLPEKLWSRLYPDRLAPKGRTLSDWLQRCKAHLARRK